ncbi:MAG: hypothetical protein QF654_06880 [Alphaproteobacteria bacterium]|jgi:hypothetical protein|nr:hypothetical protein [Alphaproteobacteria bacterium]|tara:strand:- start:810 stop:1082 length:273 start_codon:yes stop_codon:yes gene_type:complete
MEFHVFQCKADRDFFVVTDGEHVEACMKNPDATPTPGDELESVGVFGEMGRTRAAFDEAFAKHCIAKYGYYRFHSKTYDPVAQAPMAMPG